MNNLTITVETNPKVEERRKIFDGLHRFNVSQTNDADCPSVTILLRDADNTVVGGLLGETYWGWLYVEFMWIEELLRKKGYGGKLLAAAEKEAFARGCSAAYLDTFSFQAFEFYQRCGYEVFGTLDNFPLGHQRYFMRKSLTAPTNGAENLDTNKNT